MSNLKACVKRRFTMAYGETKVYFDGSHFIAIPHTTRPSLKRIQRPEELITVTEFAENTQEENSAESTFDEALSSTENEQETGNLNEETYKEQSLSNKAVKTRTVTRKELFEEFYKESLNLPKYRRKAFVLDKMKPHFNSEDIAVRFVDLQFERKQRNLICKRIRMTRKANLQKFNFFVTFTYNDELHTETTFKKKLIKYLSNFVTNYSWKYMGVWERSPKKKRLHFHGLFYIPDTSVLGCPMVRNDYSFAKHCITTTHSFTEIERLFGRGDFEDISNDVLIGNALAYLMKYLEKTGEKIVYSKGLPQFFISDIMDEDIICPIGQEDKKLLLFDDFSCWDEGCYMGQVSPEVIKQMRKAN